MAFRFPLASVLRVREGIEKREEVALQRVQLEVARVQRRIDELTEELAAASKAREEALQEAIQASRLQSMQIEIDAIVDARQTLFTTLQTLKRQRDAQMKLYRIAHSGRQMVFDLLTQQKDAYEHEQVRIQQKRLDDIMASRWRRS